MAYGRQAEPGAWRLAHNPLRATPVEGLRRENVRGKTNANRTHHEVGRKVRKTIAELGGTMPEELPMAEDVKKLEKGGRPAGVSERN